tara:strand:+ start:318 stop:731 length:414 start_codon:yes stop_codon:yes gene_type:complete
MIDRIRWDSSLFKKFSASNHFKLLNQLRNEVKKYPLNNKKQKLTPQPKENNNDNKSRSTFTQQQNINLVRDHNSNNEYKSKKSTVSFNNAKNFSIYSNIGNENKNHEKSSVSVDVNLTNNDSSAPTFKERLDQIDMR